MERAPLPVWAKYAATLMIQAVVAALLYWMTPIFPLGALPMPYILETMAIAYIFGAGPALLALTLNLFVLWYFFMTPEYGIDLSGDKYAWAKLMAFLLGSMLVVCATILMRKGQRRLAALARGLDSERAKLQAVFSNMAEGVLIFDPVGKLIDANPAALNMHGHKTFEDMRKTWEESEDIFKVSYLNGDPMPSSDWPIRRLLRGETFSDTEARLRRLDTGQEMVISYSGAPILDEAGKILLAALTSRDVTEQKQAEQRERVLEAHKLDFYRRTILAAPRGKLIVTEREEIAKIAGKPLATWDLRKPEGLRLVRQDAMQMAQSLGLASEDKYGFLACIGESTGNAFKHAGSGTASLHKMKDSLIFVVVDNGPGIEAISIPDVALTEGYTTTGTLGMGYKLMITSADRVYLATDSEGTTVAVELKLNRDEAALRV